MDPNPRQIHVTVTKEQREACWAIARKRPAATTWQEIAREAMDAGLKRLRESK